MSRINVTRLTVLLRFRLLEFRMSISLDGEQPPESPDLAAEIRSLTTLLHHFDLNGAKATETPKGGTKNRQLAISNYAATLLTREPDGSSATYAPIAVATRTSTTGLHLLMTVDALDQDVVSNTLDLGERMPPLQHAILPSRPVDLKNMAERHVYFI